MIVAEAASIILLARRGLQFRQIADELRISLSRAQRLWAAFASADDYRVRREVLFAHPPELVAQVIKLARRGETWAALGAACGKSARALWQRYATLEDRAERDQRITAKHKPPPRPTSQPRRRVEPIIASAIAGEPWKAIATTADVTVKSAFAIWDRRASPEQRAARQQNLKSRRGHRPDGSFARPLPPHVIEICARGATVIEWAEVAPDRKLNSTAKLFYRYASPDQKASRRAAIALRQAQFAPLPSEPPKPEPPRLAFRFADDPRARADLGSFERLPNPGMFGRSLIGCALR